MRKIRWGIIGAGDVNEKKSGPAFHKAENSELVAVMRRNSGKAKDYAARHNVPKWYDDAEALITDDEVDAVYVATPPYAHAEHAIRAISKHKPVYIEKPMALNYAECRDILRAAETENVKVFVAHYRRALPYFLKIKELIKNQTLGDLRFIEFRLFHAPQHEDLHQDPLPWRYHPEMSGGGLFFDLASHQLDLIDYFFGPIEQVKGLAHNQAGLYKPEDAVSASFICENDIMGTAAWNFVFPSEYQEDKAVVYGTKGRLQFSFFTPENPIILETDNTRKEFLPEFPEHIQQPLIQSIVNELLDIGKCPSTGYSGARTAKVMDEIVKNYYSES